MSFNESIKNFSNPHFFPLSFHFLLLLFKFFSRFYVDEHKKSSQRANKKWRETFSIYPVNGTSFSIAKKSTWINHTCFIVGRVPGSRWRPGWQPRRSIILVCRLIVNFYSVFIAIAINVHSIWIFNVILIRLDIVFTKRCRARALWASHSLLII